MKWYIQSEHGYYFREDQWIVEAIGRSRFNTPFEAVQALANWKLSDGRPVEFVCEIHILKESN